MTLFTSELFTDAMLAPAARVPRSYRATPFARRYGRRRDTVAERRPPALAACQIEQVRQVGDEWVRLEFDRAA